MFDCEEDAIAAIKGGKIVAGDVVVIRYEGPKGGPGMGTDLRWAEFCLPLKLQKM